MPTPDGLPLPARILQALAALEDAPGAEVSLPRLTKHLGASASVLLRHLHRMGEVAIGDAKPPAWVAVQQQDGRWLVRLLPAGRALLADLPTD